MFRTASWVSCANKAESLPPQVDKEYVRLNSTGFGEEVDIDIEDEDCSKNSIKYQIVLKVEEDEKDHSLYGIKLSTNHPSFKLKKSTVLRSFSSFYHLEKILLSSETPNPMLPLKALLWTMSQEQKVEQLTSFLSQILRNKAFLALPAVHLFCQTQLSMEIIKDNMEGRRNDDVAFHKVDEYNEINQTPLKVKEVNQETLLKLKHIWKKPVQPKTHRKNFGDHLDLFSANFVNLLPILHEGL